MIRYKECLAQVNVQQMLKTFLIVLLNLGVYIYSFILSFILQIPTNMFVPSTFAIKYSFLTIIYFIVLTSFPRGALV